MGKSKNKKISDPIEFIEALLTHPKQRTSDQKAVAGWFWSFVEREILIKLKKQKYLLTLKKEFEKVNIESKK